MPSGPSPVVHVICVDVAAVTVHSTPLMVTVLFADAVSNPVPVMAMLVPGAP